MVGVLALSAVWFLEREAKPVGGSRRYLMKRVGRSKGLKDFMGFNQKQNLPESGREASLILEKLLISGDLLQQAARSAMNAKAFSLSAELNNVRSVIIKEIFALTRGRREIVGELAPAARNIYQEITDHSQKAENK